MSSPQQPRCRYARHKLALLIPLLLLLSSSLLLRPAPAAAQGTLSCVNKTTSNGVGYAIYGIYASGSTIYAGSVQLAIHPGKLSISTDGGTTFTERSTANGLGSSSVRGIAVDGGIVYAATPGGLSISTDGAASFTNKTTANGLGNNQVWSVYANGSNVYAGTSGGVSISTDGGATFTNKTTANGLGSNAVWGDVYAAGGAIYAATNGGLAISTDGGATFSNKTTADGLGNNTVNGVYASGSTVYAATSGGLSISTDGGATFANKTTADGLGNNSVNSVYVSGNTLFAATNGGLSISTDGGATFTNYTTTNGLVGNAVLRVYLSGNTIYVGISGGLSICTLPTPPVSQVQGNGVTIASGDSTPSPADGTDFGGTTIGSTLRQAFTIRNTGSADLTSVAVTLSGSSAFSVSDHPATTISPGSSSTFTVTFTPTANGVVTATVNFTSNQDPYTFVVQGAVPTPGAALDFDGTNDYVTLPTTLNNQFSANQITLEGWFYPTASSGSSLPMLIGEAYTGDSQISFALYQEGTAVRCGFYNGSWQQTGAVNLTLNQWQHLACTYDQQAIQVYVNGEGMSGRGATAALPAGNGEWYLGRRWDLAEYYTGRMDEVRIWNRALTASEIANNMNCEPIGNPSGLVARYGFNQGTALANNSGVTSLTDSSSNAINGALSGFTLSGSASNWVSPGSAANGVACVTAPEIDVQGNGATLTNGDTTPSTTDDTDFGRLLTNDTVAHTFTINNSGAAALTGVAVTVTGSSAFQLTATPASSVAAGGSSDFTLSFTPSTNGVYTATVSIASNDSNETPYTFVVQGIRTGSNVAVGQPATQSSTYDDPCTGPASKAVDGNTSGNTGDCSFSTTNNEPQDWWQVDLGASYSIQVIDLWNRTDCCGERLSDFDLLVSTDGTNWTTFYYPGVAPTTTSFVINAMVRYVKVQLRGQNYLTLAEVQVWGPAFPEIDVLGNGVSIANGDDTPTSADQSAFGNQLPGGTTVRAFTIHNSGAATLALSGSPVVALSGNSAFTVSSQPAGSSLATNGSVPFTITFAPTAVGLVTATVSIANNDSNETPYTFVVSGVGKTADAQLNGVDCLLIDAINAANSDAASGSCPAGSGADTITLLQNVTLTAVDNANYNFDGANGLPQITSAITIEGAGYTLSRAAEAPPFRFFYVTADGILTLNDLTLHNGDATPQSRAGGALYIAWRGAATVNRSIFTANKAGSAGAIYSDGDLTVNQSTISGNVSTGNGGGIDNWERLTVNNSTISGNSAGFNGGGIHNAEMVTVTNSTVSDNSAINSGGGIYNNNEERLTLVRSLISGNRAPAGAELGNSTGNPPFSGPGIVNANNANLFGESSQTNAQALFNVTPGATDRTATSDGTHPTALAAILDPTLADNGGPSTGSGAATLTHALVAGSPALDAAGDSGLDTDQRGVTRPQGAADDIGAFELAVVAAPEIDVQGNGVSIANGDSTPTAADHTAFGNVTVGSSLVRTFTIQNSGNADLTDVVVTVDGSACAAGATSCIPAGDFTLVSAPAATIAAGTSSTFTIAFDPSAAGPVETVITIASNDSDENPYTFAVNGNGVAPTTITIVLDAQPDLPTNLGFQSSFGPFILDDPAIDDGDAYTKTRTFTVTPGTYSVRRNNPASWFTTAIACTPASNATIDLPQRRAAITVAEGNNVTCTYTVDRAARINARAFNDLVRRTTNLGKRNAGDPWLNSQPMTLTTSPTQTLGSGVTEPVGILSQISFANLRPGSYTLCTGFPTGWALTTPTAVDPAYGQPCKRVTLNPGQAATVLFGAYQPTVVASETFTPADELITDDDAIVDRPYDPTEDETLEDETMAEGTGRLFLPLILR
jgi:hypothetical protein